MADPRTVQNVKALGTPFYGQQGTDLQVTAGEISHQFRARGWNEASDKGRGRQMDVPHWSKPPYGSE